MTSFAHIRALARSGAVDRAWALFQSGEGEPRDSFEGLCLRGRLLKDKARRAAGDARAALYRAAGEAYAAAAALAPATWPLINAATLALLGGRPDEAAALAEETLDRLDSGAHVEETPYWLAATRAEALLLLGRPAAAEAALDTALAAAPAAWEDQAVTLRQFALILEAVGTDIGWLDRFRPPPSLHFRGIMGLAPDDTDAARLIDAAVAAARPGFAFGALAAGADILIAEAVIRRGGELHVVLPCRADIFRAQSVTVVDQRWGPRFDALIEGAVSVEAIEDHAAPGPAAIAIGDAMARGLALAQARLLQSRALALNVTDPGGDATIDPGWAAAGGETRAIALSRSAEVPALAELLPPAAVALVAIAGGAALSDFPLDGALWLERIDDTLLLALPDPAAAVRAAGTLAADGRATAGLALDYGLAINGRLSPFVAGRAATIARAAGAERWLASRPMALALECAMPDLRIEVAGDVRGASGAHMIYTVAAQ